MPKLVVNFAPYVADTGSAIVPMEILDAKFQRVQGVADTLELGTPVEIDVPAGEYLVRAYLPNGELLSQQITAEEGITTTADLTPEFTSPRESLSWGYLLKGPNRFGSIDNYNALLKSNWLDKGLESAGSAQPSLSTWVFRRDVGWENDSSFEPLEIRDAEVNPDSFGWLELNGVANPLWLRIDTHQQLVANKPLVMFVAIPPGDTVRVNLFRDFTAEGLINAVVDTQNPRAEAVLGFLRRGDFDFARTVGSGFADTAEELLRGKFSDLSAAVIGGYFLLTAGDIARLHDWTSTLDTRFPFLPDGAVIHAWHCLRKPTPDFALARSRFIEAAARGIPVYTRGLRLLHDGLKLINARSFEQHDVDDDQAKAALDFVKPYAAAADWTSGTTAFVGADPNKPGQ